PALAAGTAAHHHVASGGCGTLGWRDTGRLAGQRRRRLRGGTGVGGEQRGEAHVAGGTGGRHAGGRGRLTARRDRPGVVSVSGVPKAGGGAPALWASGGAAEWLRADQQ